MTLNEFCKIVPIANDIKILLEGDVIFGSHDLSQKFLVVTAVDLRNRLSEISKDYNLIGVSAYNNMLMLTLE